MIVNVMPLMMMFYDDNDDNNDDDDDDDDAHWFGWVEMLPDGGSHDDQRFAYQMDDPVL